MNILETIKRKSECLADKYDNTPLLKALIQVVSGSVPFGVGNAVETFVMTNLENARIERQRAFFDELQAGNIELTEEKINNEDFLYFWSATMKAVNSTRDKEKIRLFSRMFNTFSKGENFEKVDEYEEWLAILNDLTVREFRLLIMLEQNFSRVTGGYNNASAQKWAEFDEKVEKELQIPRQDVAGVLVRLTRTGFYQVEVGYSSNARGHVTSNFDSFLQGLEITPNDSSLVN